MAYQKRRFVPRGEGESWGILTLEERERLFYFLECPQPAAGDIVLFYGPHSWRKLTGNCGHQLCMQSRLGEIQAAALLREGKAVLRGSAGPFGWEEALLAYEKAQKPAEPRGNGAPRPGWTRMRGRRPRKRKGECGNRRPRHPGKQKFRKPEAPGKPAGAGKDCRRKRRPLRAPEIPEPCSFLDSLPQMEMASPPAKPAGIPEKPVREEKKSCHPKRIRSVQPFSYLFEDSRWERVEYPFAYGQSGYLKGEIYRDGALIATAMAIPGKYALTPPPWLKGFNTYLQEQDGPAGYWVLLRDSATGTPPTCRPFYRRSGRSLQGTDFHMLREDLAVGIAIPLLIASVIHPDGADIRVYAVQDSLGLQDPVAVANRIEAHGASLILLQIPHDGADGVVCHIGALLFFAGIRISRIRKIMRRRRFSQAGRRNFTAI